mmetsp:Transcript_53430/g.130550  ORF Transcript_53430/g.130550 Transcript_53430/m.130550 type:complete len:165 (-) Transcript_53430:345-839(-)
MGVMDKSGLAGTGFLTKNAISRAADIRSLPTQVHVKPSSINCNSLRSDQTMYMPSVLIGNWSEQRLFDSAHTVNPQVKAKGFHYNKVQEVFHDRICPPTLGGVAPRYLTENRCMSDWLPRQREKLPDVDTIRDSLGKPFYNDTDMDMYATTSNAIGSSDTVRFQ